MMIILTRSAVGTYMYRSPRNMGHPVPSDVQKVMGRGTKRNIFFIIAKIYKIYIKMYQINIKQ